MHVSPLESPSPHPDPKGHVGPEIEVPHVELDETIPPRPEEDVADATRDEG